MNRHVWAVTLILIVGGWGCKDQERIDRLEAEVTRLEDDLQSAEDDKAAAEAERDMLQEDNDTLTTANEALETDNAALETEVDKLSGEVTTLQADVDALTMDMESLTAYATQLEELLSPPPSFFDALYPPVAMQPTLIFEMFGMSDAFEGILVDLGEGDLDALSDDMAAFRAAYEHVRTDVIPQLADHMPIEPIDDLEAAINSGNPAAIGPAIGAVGAVCGDCHTQYANRARIQYQWRDFGSFTVTDPVQSEEVAWVDYMFGMALQLTGIGHNLGQGQVSAAQANFANFESYYTELENACTNCHNTPRTYFVSDDVDAMVTALGAEMSQPTPDPAAVGSMVGAIGNASCGGCHNLHQPAQHTKELWEYVEGLSP